MVDLFGSNQTVASLSDYNGSGGSIVNGAVGSPSVLTISPTGGSTMFSGSIKGGGTLGTISLVVNGPGTQILAGPNTYTGPTSILQGVLQAIDGVGLPENSNLSFSGNLAAYGYGAVFQSSGTFSRTLGSGPGQVQWLGDGGFAAQGGPLTLSMSPTAALAWNNNSNTNGTPGFLPDGSVLTFGSPTADNQVNFTDSLDLNGGTRQIDVASRPGWQQCLDIRRHHRQSRRRQPAQDRCGRVDPQRQQQL